VSAALYGQESGSGANTRTSVTGATGGMQIQPATFQQYAKPGEDINNKADNLAVGNRIVADYMQKYGGDPQRVAVAYFSGPGNVAPAGSPTPWLRDAADPTGKRTSSYVSDVMKRLGQPATSPAGNFAPAGHDVYGPAGPRPPISPPETPTTPTTPSTPGVEDAAFTPPKSPTPPVSAEDIKAALDQHLAAKMAWIDEQALPPRAQEAAERAARAQYTDALIRYNMTAKAEKDKKDAVYNDVDGDVFKRDYHSASGKIQQYLSSGAINNTEALTLEERVRKASGEPNVKDFGPRYKEAMDGILAEPGDPKRISDISQLWKMYNNGDLSEAGLQKSRVALADIKKDVNTAGVMTTKQGAYADAKKYLSFEQNDGIVKIHDPAGEHIFNTKFLPQFESAFDNWTIKQGLDPYKFPLFEPDKMKEFLHGLRPERDKNSAYMAAMGENAQAPEAANAPLPPAPSGIDQERWEPAVRTPPNGRGGPVNHQIWGAALAQLAADPPGMAARFDKLFSRFGVNAEMELGKLGIAYKPRPGKPENVGNPQPPKEEQSPLPQMPPSEVPPITELDQYKGQ
jgi:hypothetical protein